MHNPNSDLMPQDYICVRTERYACVPSDSDTF